MVTRTEPLRKKADYYEVKEGSFRVPSEKENPNAVARQFVHPKTGVATVVYEIGYDSMTGFIENIRFFENTLNDGTVLRSLHIIMGEGANGRDQIISVPIDSRYASDFLKKLPNIDLSKEVKLRPFDFKKDGPRQVGFSILQEDNMGTWTVAIGNAFEKQEEKDGKKVWVTYHGFPEATEEDRSDWPFYFKKVSKFLIKYTNENIIPKFGAIEKQVAGSTEATAGVDDRDEKMDAAMDEAFGSNPDKIPF